MSVAMEEVEMSKVQLKPGDYVSTERMIEEQYHAVAERFLEAGAPPGEYPNTKEMRRLDFFGWENGYHGKRTLFHGCMAKGRWGDRHLSIEQVLGSEPEEEWNGVGLPPFGAKVEIQSRIGPQEVEVVGYHDSDYGYHAVIYAGHDEYCRANPNCLSPLRTTEERERDEVAQDLIDNQLACTMDYAKVLAEQLLEAGYRKQVEPHEDMTDPANWRAGDVLECLSGGGPIITVGRHYTILEKDEDGDPIIEQNDGAKEGEFAHHFRFHHRPQ